MKTEHIPFGGTIWVSAAALTKIAAACDSPPEPTKALIELMRSGPRGRAS